jgi:hypothetical protein
MRKALNQYYGKEPKLELQFMGEKKADNILIDLDFFKELQEKARKKNESSSTSGH